MKKMVEVHDGIVITQGERLLAVQVIAVQGPKRKRTYEAIDASGTMFTIQQADIVKDDYRLCHLDALLDSTLRKHTADSFLGRAYRD